MSFLVKFYGDLKKKSLVQSGDSRIPATMEIEINKGCTVFDLLKQFNIEENEISHIFVNGVYCGSGKVIKSGDRVGIFPRRMGIMFVEITKTKSIYAKIILDKSLRQFGPVDTNVELPEGTTIALLLNKYKITMKKHVLKIVINEKRVYKKDYTIRNGDTLEIFPIRPES